MVVNEFGINKDDDNINNAKLICLAVLLGAPSKSPGLLN